MDDPLPLDFGLLEIDEETKAESGGSEIIKALRGVLAGETFHAFQLDYKYAFDEDVGKVLADRVALVGDSQSS